MHKILYKEFVYYCQSMSLFHLDVLQKDLNEKSVMILSAHNFGIANNAVSFSGFVISLNSSESNKT